MIDASESKMSRGSRTSRERRSTVIADPFEQDNVKDEASVHAVMRRSSTPSQKRWSSSEESNRPYSREMKSFSRNNTEDTETESPDIKSNDEPLRTERHARGKARYSDVRTSEERIAAKSLGERRRKHGKRIERRKLGERPRTADRERVGSSTRHYNGESSFTDKSRKREKNASQANDEIPITEILKKAQENSRTKYEEPVPLPELTTDTIYIQGRSGFSAMKIGGLRRALENDTTHATNTGMAEDRDFAEPQTHTLIRVAITAQKFWKRMGFVYQGLLGGAALLHLIMIHLFFDASQEFVANYSIFSEVYANMFSFLIALCVISIFDKFDLARLDMDHFREIYTDHAKTALAIPLYLVTFCLHQVSSKLDDQLALAHYYENSRINSTTLGNFLEELNSWQKITTSKNLLAVFAWLFVALGTRDNMLLMHLESMEKYASDAESHT